MPGKNTIRIIEPRKRRDGGPCLAQKIFFEKKPSRRGGDPLGKEGAMVGGKKKKAHPKGVV